MDWVATILGITGCFLVGKHKRIGWLFYACGSLVWIFLSIHVGLYGMTAGAILYFILETRGYIIFNKVRDQKLIENTRDKMKELL